jgi:voltage-gated potassium channel
MLFGYGIIAVPTGLVGAEVALTEFAARIDARLADQVVIHEHSDDECAGSIPAFAIVHGAVDTGEGVC